MNQKDPIAIVSMGCVFPQANSPEELWNICQKGENTFADLSSSRWNIDHHYSADRTAPDKIYSKIAAEIPFQQFQKLRVLHDLNEETSRLEAYLIHAMSQVLQAKHDGARTGVVLGLMNPDDEFNLGLAQKRNCEIFSLAKKERADHSAQSALEKFMAYREQEYQEKWERKDRFLAYEVLSKVCQRFALKNISFLVDSACASSLASIDLGISLLQAGCLDTAIVGGAESNLSPGMYAVFSRVGALAETASLPFDENTQGLIQGEGAGLFAIQKLSYALDQGNEVLAVFYGSDGSSDGKTSSLFQPDVQGQMLSYDRVHRDLDKTLAHLEAHGTGTKIGDLTESRSIGEYFQDQSFPVSSIKSLIGHTKGAAGAAGLIKTLFMMQEGRVPASPYLQRPLRQQGQSFFNQEPLEFDSLDKDKLFGVSGFGFGGTNYHSVVGRYHDSLKPEPSSRQWQDLHESQVVGEFEMDYSDFDPHWFLSPESPYRLPPQSLHSIDRAQLMAVQMAFEAMKTSGLSFDYFAAEDVVTVSSSILGLDLCSELAARLQIPAFQEQAKERPMGLTEEEAQILVDSFENIKTHFQPCTEDHAPGLLNNVMAGRVCHAFDLKGRGYNIDAGIHSKDCGLFLADLEIRLGRAPLVVFVYLLESFLGEDQPHPVKRERVGAKILTSEAVCRQYFLKPKGRLHTEFLPHV